VTGSGPSLITSTSISPGSGSVTRCTLSASIGGASAANIAETLYLSEGTVRNHLSIAIQKLGARNRIEAARLAEEKGWLKV